MNVWKMLLDILLILKRAKNVTMQNVYPEAGSRVQVITVLVYICSYPIRSMTVLRISTVSIATNLESYHDSCLHWYFGLIVEWDERSKGCTYFSVYCVQRWLSDMRAVWVESSWCDSFSEKHDYCDRISGKSSNKISYFFTVRTIYNHIALNENPIIAFQGV